MSEPNVYSEQDDLANKQTYSYEVICNNCSCRSVLAIPKGVTIDSFLTNHLCIRCGCEVRGRLREATWMGGPFPVSHSFDRLQKPSAVGIYINDRPKTVSGTIGLREIMVSDNPANHLPSGMRIGDIFDSPGGRVPKISAV